MSHCHHESCCTHECCHHHHHCHCHCHSECQECSSQHCGCGSQKHQCGHQHHGCGCHSQSCEDRSCEITSCEEEGAEHAYQLLELADEAWLEVLKEKLMERIRASDSKLNQLADVIAETNRKRWHNKMSEEQCSADFMQKLKDLLKQHHQQSSESNPGQQQRGDKKEGNKTK